MEAENEAVVVPLVATTSEPSTEAMLRMLLNREAILVQRNSGASTGPSSGLVAQSAGAFAKAISQATAPLGRVASSEGLFTVSLPSGAVARELVPAVGGGFRGMVRAAGSTKVVGQARLIPAAGGVAGAGATIAAGPLIATVGLAVAGEMLAQHQMNKKLDGIKHALVDLQTRMDDHEHSVIVTAAQQTRKVAAYLLDQANMPSIGGAGHAFGELDNLTNRYIEQLHRWSDVAGRYANAERVYAPELLGALVGKEDNPTRVFERRVAQTYEALALRARVAVLEKVAAEFTNQDRSLTHVENVLRDELSGIADEQARLVELLDDLSVMQLDASKAPVAFAGKGTLAARTTFSRLARALHANPDGLPVLTESDRTVLELAPTSRGFSVMAPSEA